MYLLFNTGIAILGASKASVTFYLQTLFTVILAYFLLGEQLHIYHAVGIALIAAGIVLVTLIKPVKQGAGPDVLASQPAPAPDSHRQ